MFNKWLPGLLVLLTAFSSFAEDYTFLWWADGWRGRAAEWHKVLNIQTNHYAGSIDVEKPALPHLGDIGNAQPYAEAVSESNERVNSLPPAELKLVVTVGGVEYRCVRAAGNQEDEANFPVRIIESGRYVQRAHILNAVLQDDRGAQLEAEGRIEVIATPSRLHLLFEVMPKRELRDVSVAVELNQVKASKHFDVVAAGERALSGVAWPPDTEQQVTVTSEGLPVERDALRGWYYVDLPERQWSMASELDRLDRFPVRVTNSGTQTETCLILFAFDGAPFEGITGLCPILRDKDGVPTGIPVQISKNWHQQKDRHFLYEGPWFHAFAEVPVEAGKTWEGELAITYGRWGGVPGASHAQLCLIGWGTNQLWDQAAIGSFGESITYDPDVCLNRSMIDDVRPLMVTGMSGGQWEWTCNVGGGDFLVYLDANDKRQYLTRMRTAYLSQGPNLTDVVYSGVTADGAIAARIEVSTPRCDDVNRAYHRIRYDVLADTAFSRMAFYQLGADNYNDHTFTTLARGNAEGLLEEWPAERGGKKYLRAGMECTGTAPWFSLHGGERNDYHPKGGWANRGLVVRSWSARLGGVEVATPFAAVFGTENGVPSANVELSPPPGLAQLKKGDFVEAEIELLIVPSKADDYYGPNEPLRSDLKANANTWRPIQRLARGNDLQIVVGKGRLLDRYPIVIQADNDQAEFEVRGGVGYVPVRIEGLHRYKGYALTCDNEPVGYWQTQFDAASGTWSHTYNVLLDSTEQTPRKFAFAPAPGQ